jgi:Concanavalin A-like lectin/glucanases superfamily/Cellulase (glycosyl hydrolase family 5)
VARRGLLRGLTRVAVLGAGLLLVPLAAAAGRPLRTAVVDPATFSSPEADLGFARTSSAGATLVRLNISWASSGPAPGDPAKPAGFDVSNPADPQYDFTQLDQQVRLAVAHGLQPVLSFDSAPLWAQDQSPHPSTYAGYAAHSYKPDPKEVGRFAHALATRYGGSFEGLPRIRYWQLWNEPNLTGFLSPQFENGQPFAAVWFRKMLNAYADAVRGVHPDNVVIAGGLSPIAIPEAATAPLAFMRALLCMSAASNPKPTCSEQTSLDAVALHPYTSGGPRHRAFEPANVQLGDLPEAKRLLDAAAASHHIRSTIPPELWVTEFSWDTRPADPNPLAAPIALQSQWTAEALYRMWKAGVSMVTWWLLRDLPWPTSAFQSGLYFRSGIDLAHDLAKPTLTAFKFPFVTFRQRGGRLVWGRTPAGRPARVAIEQRLPSKWKRITTLKSDANGIFSKVLRRRIVQPKAPRPAFVTTRYRTAVLADHPTAYWRLDDRGGTVASDVVGQHPGALTGGVTLGIPGALRNDRDTAAAFNGTDGKIEVGTESPRTVELWLKTTDDQDTAAFSNRDALGQFLYVGAFERVPNAFDSFSLFGGATVADNRWHHIVYTYSGDTGTVYVDGRLDASNTWLRVEGGALASIGFDAFLKKYFKGSIDEVALYDHPLSAGRVRAHFLASGRRIPPSPDLGGLRARVLGSGDVSLPFPLKAPPDRHVLPFGG